MRYPRFTNVSRYRESTNVFGGYNHTLSCADGQYWDMKNMTADDYPVMSPRKKRGISAFKTNDHETQTVVFDTKLADEPSAMLDKEGIMWIVGDKLYRNGKDINLNAKIDKTKRPKAMAKMGAYVVIIPDNIWYNASTGESGYIDAESIVNGSVTFSLCASDGTPIKAKSEEYYEEYEPKEGDYMLITNNGKPSLKVYSKTTGMWVNVVTAYMQISATGIGKGFKKGDGVLLTVDTTGIEWDYAKTLFPNEAEDGKRTLNAQITGLTEDAITVVGLLDAEHTFENMSITVSRKAPDMAFITECNNRLWGCSLDGHEIYCCSLGDVTNWNCFAGISTDSWRATIGSDGKFTGAISYQGYPTFFKEDSIIKVAVSSQGAHQIKETNCRGVQNGSEKSLCILNEVLYFKATNGVCAYDGALPVTISNNLGWVRYKNAVGGTIDNKYYISMLDESEVPHLFVYDSSKNIWTKEDNADICCFCKCDNELYFAEKFIDEDGRTRAYLKSVGGGHVDESLLQNQTEGKIAWSAESGNIGYSLPDNKYIARVNIRITLEVGTDVDFYLQYDSSGVWEHKFNMNGKGTRTFTVPVIPKRCDHFKYKLVGKGDCKIYSITKTIEEGSDC